VRRVGPCLLCQGFISLILGLGEEAFPLGGALEAVLAHDTLHHLAVAQLPDALKVLLCQNPPILQQFLRHNRKLEYLSKALIYQSENGETGLF